MRSLPRLVRAVLLGLALGAGAIPASAQESQVPLDRDGELMEVNRSLATRLGLWVDEYPDLEVVRLYEEDGGSFILEITSLRDGRRVRARLPMSASEVASLRDRVSGLLGERAPAVLRNQDGRFLLLGTTTALGLGYYGWAVPVALGVEDGRGFLATYMFTAGASFLFPYLYTRDRPVTYGMANAGFWGATRGISHGTYLALLMSHSGNGELVAGMGVVGSLAEGLAGYNWARATDMSAGDAHVIGNFGDFGTAWAASSLMMVQTGGEAMAYAALLTGAGVGIAAGAHRAEALPYTWGDAEIQRMAFLLGAAHGAVVWDWVLGEGTTDDDVRILGATLLAGSVAGLVLGDRALEGLDYSAGQGILVDLGTIAGGLLGTGLAFLATPEDSDATPFLTLATIGADIGFLATLASLRGDARERAERAPAGSMELDLNPGALFLLRGERPEHATGPEIRLPLVSVRYRF